MTTRSPWMVRDTALSSSPTGRPSYCFGSAMLDISRQSGPRFSAMWEGCGPATRAHKITTSSFVPPSARRVVHVPHVLYHWRFHPGSTAKDGHTKPQSFEAGQRAVEEAFRRRGVDCRVIQSDWARQAGCAAFETGHARRWAVGGDHRHDVEPAILFQTHRGASRNHLPQLPDLRH